MAFLTAARDLLVLDGVDKAVDTFLMQVECALFAVVERFKLVHMDEAIERG